MRYSLSIILIFIKRTVDPQFRPSTLALILGVPPIPSRLYVMTLALYGLNRFLSLVYVHLYFMMVRVGGSFWSVVMALSLCPYRAIGRK